MVGLRWLTRNWEEIHESGIKRKSERVLQYRNIEIDSAAGEVWSEWKDVEEESMDI